MFKFYQYIFIENVEQASGADCTYLCKHKNIQFYIQVYIYIHIYIYICINSIYTSLKIFVMGMNNMVIYGWMNNNIIEYISCKEILTTHGII